jgi:hypothetical protein
VIDTYSENLVSISITRKQSLKKRFVLKTGLWIRIGSGFRDFVDPDPGARKLRNFSGKNALFSYF